MDTPVDVRDAKHATARALKMKFVENMVSVGMQTSNTVKGSAAPPRSHGVPEASLILRRRAYSMRQAREIS